MLSVSEGLRGWSERESGSESGRDKSVETIVVLKRGIVLTVPARGVVPHPVLFFFNF